MWTLMILWLHPYSHAGSRGANVFYVCITRTHKQVFHPHYFCAFVSYSKGHLLFGQFTARQVHQVWLVLVGVVQASAGTTVRVACSCSRSALWLSVRVIYFPQPRSPAAFRWTPVIAVISITIQASSFGHSACFCFCSFQESLRETNHLLVNH